MHGFFESLRTELAPEGVAVMMVCPSFIATHIDRNALGGDGGPVRHAQVTVGRPLTRGGGGRAHRRGRRAPAADAVHRPNRAPGLVVEPGRAGSVRADHVATPAGRAAGAVRPARSCATGTARGILGPSEQQRCTGESTMKVHVKHTLKTDVASALKLCTDQKHQETVYDQLGGSDVKIKREGRSPNVTLRISRKEVANPPAAIRRLVPATNEVSHTEDWSADGDGYAADIDIDIKGVPVKIVGTKTLQPEKGGCSVEWKFDVTSGIPLLGGIIASFAGARDREEARGGVQDPEVARLIAHPGDCCGAASHLRDGAPVRGGVGSWHASAVHRRPGVLPARDRTSGR